MSTEEKAWLIERADPRNPGCTLSKFLGVNGSTAHPAGGDLAWHDSVTWALRFARQVDAELFIGVMERMSERLLHGKTLPGLRAGDPRALVVEHLWTDGVAPHAK